METWLTSAILVGVGALIAAMVVDAWSRVAWRRRRLALDVARYSALADALARRDEAIVQNLSQSRSWNGFRNFRITRKVREADNVVSLFLRPHDGRAVPAFLPGQFLTFRFHDEAGGTPTIRCYSLSQAYSPELDYRVTIKRLAPPPDAPPGTPWGKSSSYFHQVEEDNVVEVGPPAGQFTLDLAAGRPVVFIAGGIGVTPFLAMTEHLARHEPEREAWLFHGVKNPREQVAADRLRAWAEKPNFHFVTCYSQPLEDAQSAQPFEEKSIVTLEVLRQWLPSSNYEFFVCGPPPMMTAIMDGLRQWGVPPGSIHMEAFSSETVREIGMASLLAGQAATWEVAFRGNDKRLQWRGDSGTILDLAERNGIFLPSGCRAGNCGTCAAPVLAGSFTYLAKPEARVDEGNCLVCISVPAEDMEFA